jgi:hypothetical protein
MNVNSISILFGALGLRYRPGREMVASLIERQAEGVSEEPGSGHFVTRRHDGVV